LCRNPPCHGRENEKYTDRPDGRFPWLELAIDFNANGKRASSANDPMRLCEQCSAATEMQRVSLHKECLFPWKALADVPDAKVGSLDLLSGGELSFCLATSRRIFQDRPMKTTTLSANLRKRLLLIPLLACSLLTSAEAVSPPPDGGYAGGNTAEGQTALFSLTSGMYNTAVGLFSLRNVTGGSFNTALGAGTLLSNTGDQNTATGAGALLSNTTGENNTATGESALFSNTTGGSNTAVGAQALLNNTTASDNTATGVGALQSNTTGNTNTASGVEALRDNTTGNWNTATGVHALLNNTTGSNNTANGVNALVNNTTGSNNTAIGIQALRNNTTGVNNTANGVDALRNNTTGSNNTANGRAALFGNTTGNINTAIGVNALQSNTTGNNNTAIGIQALQRNTTGNNDTAIGIQALQRNTTGNFNIALGENAGINLTTGDDNIDIGYNVSGPAGESGTIRIGDPNAQGSTFIAGISGAAVPGGAPVVVDTSGHVGTIVSSVRFKNDVKPMDKASEAILALKPITFRYKKELDPQGIPQFGLVAEQVAKVNPNLVARDAKGEVYTVRYEAVNTMLLNEFLKEHRRVETQQAMIAELKNEIETLVAHVREQDTKIQKVSERIELSRPATNLANTGR
jgi:hypothetical protein